MSFTTCQVHFTGKSGRTVYASRTLFKKLNLPPQKKTVKLVLGTKAIKAPVKRLRKTGQHLYVPKDVQALLHLPRKKNSHIRNDGGAIKLGPMIGIMTSSINRSSQRPFGTRTELIRTLLKAGPKKFIQFRFPF